MINYGKLGRTMVAIVGSALGLYLLIVAVPYRIQTGEEYRAVFDAFLGPDA